MADNIRELPVDEIPPTLDEKDMIQWLFKNQQVSKNVPEENTIPKPATKQFHNEIKLIFIIFMFYILFSNSYTQSFLLKFSPIKNDILILSISGIIFTLFTYFYINWNYSQV